MFDTQALERALRLYFKSRRGAGAPGGHLQPALRPRPRGGALAAWRIPLGNMGLQASRRGAGVPFGDFSAKNRNPFRSCFPLILSFTISAFVCILCLRRHLYLCLEFDLRPLSKICHSQ